MSQTGSIGTALGASASIAANLRNAQTQAATDQARFEISQQRAAARQNEIATQRQSDAESRALQLARAQATAVARAASGGLVPSDGSAAAIRTGQAQDAAVAQRQANVRFDAQLQSIAPSLLAPEDPTAALLRSGRSLGSLVNSLLD
jgi:hypothetical protein